MMKRHNKSLQRTCLRGCASPAAHDGHAAELNTLHFVHMKVLIITTCLIMLFARNLIAAGKIFVSPITDVYVEGAGCSYNIPGTNEGFFIEDSGTGEVWIGINGKTEKLHGDGPSIEKKDKAGIVHSIHRYKNETLKIEIDDVIASQGEGGTSFNSIFTIQKGNSKTNIKATGGCGC